MRSLLARLTLAFVAVGVGGALLVALLIGWQTQRQFDRYVLSLYEEQIAELNSQLETYYQNQGSWEGVNTVAVAVRDRTSDRRGRAGPWQRITLVGADGAVVSSGSPTYQIGERITTRALRNGIPVQVEGQTVGWLLLDGLSAPSEGPPRNSPEGRGSAPSTPENAFLSNVWRAALLSALAATGLALLLGALLARTISRPVRALTAATQAVAQGDLGRQVAVHTQDELGELATSFNRMSADLAQMTHQRRQMTANIAHDLRTPLSALLGYTEALRDGKFAATPEIFRILHQESQHLQRLVDDLHTLSLAEAGELPLHPEPTAPVALLERVALTHRAQAEAQGIDLRVQDGGVLNRIQIDPERIVQVLGNLVQNALRHTPEGGTITLRASAVGHQVRLQVEDNGEGIAPEALPHIWERLYRGDKSRAADGSSGLGLSIARSLILAHGGTIDVASTPGHGTTFTIRLNA